MLLTDEGEGALPYEVEGSYDDCNCYEACEGAEQHGHPQSIRSLQQQQQLLRYFELLSRT